MAFMAIHELRTVRLLDVKFWEFLALIVKAFWDGVHLSGSFRPLVQGLHYLRKEH